METGDRAVQTLQQQLNALFEHKTPESFMDLALKEAARAHEADEVPVGAVVVDIPTGRLVAKAHNQRELLNDPTAHAEVLAITQAAAHYESWRLERAVLFVTLEPCLMCAGAIVLARLPFVYYGADDPKAGAHRSVYEVLENPANNHVPAVVAGTRAGESGRLLTDFFRARRGRASDAARPGGSEGSNGTGRSGEADSR